uniref:Uncharacterized protein n=1 Tax=Rhizophagus irregularis (strain DAOM 181602 / DAOM 197198 / MUCL 43194) TaxID=747089 RepID=U9UGA6_RHIID
MKQSALTQLIEQAKQKKKDKSMLLKIESTPGGFNSNGNGMFLMVGEHPN